MSPEAVRQAAELLLRARRAAEALEALPEACALADLADAYAVQAAFAAAAGREVVGYKVGATTEAAQQAIGLEGPFWGRVLAGGVHDSPAELAAAADPVRVVEPEFVFRLAAGLDPAEAPFEAEDAAAVVAAVHPGMELVTSAFGPDWKAAGGPSVVADNGVHGGLVLGPAWHEWRGLDLRAHAVRLAVDGAPASEGTGAKAMGDPLSSLTWLANELARHGLALKAGDVVATGVVTAPRALAPGEWALADFGPLGEVRVGFAA